MKRIITLAFSMIFVLSAFGQRLAYENNSKWFLGLDAGAAWNTTDVQNKTYAGWGLMLGRSFNYDYGRALSYDFRFRYLRGKWRGQDYDSTNLQHLGPTYNGALLDYKNNLGYTVNNFETDVHELGLELAIHFNRLRDRSGWDPYIFGGANLVWNQTNGDLIEQDFFLNNYGTYEYDQMSMDKLTIDLATDGNYESVLDGSTAGQFNVNFMPSLGLGLGYDFGPRFQMGIEHKTTFTLRDDFDGYVDAAPNVGFLQNDVYHYTSAFMRFRFGNGNLRTQPDPDPVPDPNPIGTTTAPCQLPVVQLVRPVQRMENVTTQSYLFQTEVKFVQSRGNIVMRINGVETTNFLYNPDSHQLESYLTLNAGNNTIEITATNGCGSDTETATIVFDNCINPIVNFQNVSNNTAQVERSNYSVLAQLQNATSVEYTVNGTRVTNFTFNSTTGQFQSNLSLNLGQNTIRITAINACGNDTETIVVTYSDCADPLISFMNGNNGVILVSQSAYSLKANVFNVASKTNISVRLNGVTKTFTFNPSTNLVEATLALNAGQNVIQITATNNCGTDTENLTVEYTPCVAPSIQLLQPLAQSTTTTNGTQVIGAKLINVANASQIQLTVNGNLQSGGTYNVVTKLYEATVSLNAGFNTIQLTVLNECGSDTETISVNYNPCNTPDVQLTLPASNGGFTTSASQVVQAMVFNVNNVNEIVTYLNGAAQSGGSYSANGLYQNTVNLPLGNNTIQVVATNSCGSDVATVTITHNACVAPTVTFTYPATNPFYTGATSLNISALVGEVLNAAQIQLMVNGIVDASGATYNAGNDTYQNTVNLNAGNNVIKITATNSCGTAVKEINIVREVTITDPNQSVDSIVICYVQSNNVGEPQTLTIPLSSWPAFQAQGAQLGACPVVVEPVDLPMTICYTVNNNPTTLLILTSEWPAYQALGATQGACPVVMMSICFNGNPLSIPSSQWSAYQSQGATQGPCTVISDPSIAICLNGTAMTILTSQWNSYQAQGATLGACPVVDPQITICLNGTAMTILTSQWASYQTQGATAGPCPVVEEKITICHKPPGNPTNTQELEIPLSAWPAHQAHGDILGPCVVAVVDPQITICLNGTEMTILTSQWASYQTQGATAGPCPVVEEKITICHKPPGNPTNTQELEIPLSAWPAHQAHGDILGPCVVPVVDPQIAICLNGTAMTILTSQWASYQTQGATVGPCPVVEEKITICHKPPGNPTNTQELEIPLSAWPAHQAHGDILGPCVVPVVDPQITICLNGTEMTILTSQWASYQSQGATAGPCPVVEEKITICHKPPGNPTNTQELEIPLSAWPAHQAHGDNLGPCVVPVVDPQITICLNGTEMTILTSQWASYQSQGATAGPCPVVEEKITICHKPPGNPTNTQELEIPLSAWPAHQAHGDILGPCVVPVVDPQITICLNGTEMTILTSQWASYQTQGATAGPCPVVEEKITICHKPPGNPTNTQELEIPLSAWSAHQAHGDILGPCVVPVVDPQITICLNGTEMTILTSQWASYQAQGATLGACIDINDDGIENADTLINIGRPGKKVGTEGGGNNDGSMNGGGNELLFGNSKITICHTPEGSIGSQTIEIPVDQWDQYQQQGASLGPCSSSIGNNGGFGISTPVNGNGSGTIDPKSNPGGGNNSGSGNLQTIPNGSQQATQGALKTKEAEDKAKAEAAKKAAEAENARLQAEEAKRQAAEAEAARVRSEQAAKAEAAKKAAEAQNARLQAEEAKRQAAEAEAARVRSEQAAKAEAAKKAAEAENASRQAEEAKRQAAEAEAVRVRSEQAAKAEAAKKAAEAENASRQAEEAKRQAAEAEAARVRSEQAAKAEAAKKAAEAENARREAEEAKRQAAEAEAAKARAEQAAKEAAAKKAAEEAAAKKAAEEAEKKKAEQERLIEEREGGR